MRKVGERRAGGKASVPKKWIFRSNPRNPDRKQEKKERESEGVKKKKRKKRKKEIEK